MKSTEANQIKAIAIHEAAHAVITAFFGFRLIEVSIEETSRSLGYVEASTPSRQDHPMEFEQAERRIISLLAGTLAAHYLFPSNPKWPSASSSDGVAIAYLLKDVCYFTEEKRPQALKRLKAVTTAWVIYPAIKDAIRNFANELLARKRISGRQATRLVNKLLRNEFSAPTAKPMINWDLLRGADV